jgi:predicted phage baseplate assembly protein
MPLPVPKLDSRTWEELTTEARALLPRLAPGWTDHNVHDPGITLVELFAWLTELLLFQLDRLPPATLRSYLRLAGVTPHPAGVAATVVALRQPPGAAGPVTLRQGFQVSDDAREVRFESSRGLTVSRAWLELDPAEATTRGRVVVEDGGGLVDVTPGRGANERWFSPFGAYPRPGNAVRLGFSELPAGPGQRLSLYVWTASWMTDAGQAAKLQAESVRLAAHCGRPARRDWLRHYRARTVWEYWAGAAGWRRLQVPADETRGLTLSGRVVLRGPPVHPRDPANGRHWIRCRLTAGGYDCPPVLRTIAVNAVPVRHAATFLRLEALGRSRGTANQSFMLARRPVVAGSTRLRIVAGGTADDDWLEVTTWDQTGPDDRHYRLVPEGGTIAFGDGRRGRVPPAGAQVEVRGYRVGGGPAGNLPAGRLTRLVGSGALLPVVQPYPAAGGAPAEPLGRAHGRALDRLAEPARGVTTADLETLALETPGVPVGRAHAVAGHHPAFGCVPAAGVVTVVVLARCGDPPVPSRELLEAVRRYLEPRRPLTTELHVVGPTYLPVTVSATLHAAAGAPPDLARRADQALTAFFHPLTGGTDGSGWPFGRDVLESEVMAQLQALPEVRFVDRLGISGPDDAAPRCGNLSLCPTQLVWSRPHRITVEEGTR